MIIVGLILWFSNQTQPIFAERNLEMYLGLQISRIQNVHEELIFGVWRIILYLDYSKIFNPS